MIRALTLWLTLALSLSTALVWADPPDPYRDRCKTHDFGQGRGRPVWATGGILTYFEDCPNGPDKEIGQKRGFCSGLDLDFAHHLFQEGDYERAVTEVKRFLFLRPNDQRRDEALLLLGRAYLAAGRLGPARGTLENILGQTDRPDLLVAAWLDLGRCLERIDPEQEAIRYYRCSIFFPGWTEDLSKYIPSVAFYRLGWLHMDAGRWPEASQAFQKVAAGHPLKTAAETLATKASAGGHLPVRSPTLAAVLSAVLPGAGQVYLGRLTDAGLAFFFNAFFLWAIYGAWKKKVWSVLLILAILEIGWYGGNIYNALNGAHIRNRETRGLFLKNVHRDYQRWPEDRLVWTNGFKSEK